jgi:2-hydroxy-4-(methylsulfanyl)butanoate S-methyltransferase
MESVVKAEQISNIAFGFMASKALFVALHCNIFTNLSGEAKSAKKLAEEVGVPENRISTICTALNSIGLLERENELYSNSEGAEAFLVKGARYDFGDYLRLQIDRQMYGFMQQLEGVITDNIKPDYIDSYAKWMDDKKEARLYSESQQQVP